MLAARCRLLIPVKPMKPVNCFSRLSGCSRECVVHESLMPHVYVQGEVQVLVSTWTRIGLSGSEYRQKALFESIKSMDQGAWDMYTQCISMRW